ncbi:MAG: L,D-transpeptidase family protein [Clostridia bacterium]|nr:L,D-transpeptidase family protein [Clostridia bacterium]
MISAFGNTFAEESAELKSVSFIQGEKVQNVSAEFHEGRHFVRLNDLGNLLGARAEDNKLLLDREHLKIAFMENSRMIDVDGSVMIGSTPAYTRTGQLYVPVSIVSEIFGINLQWDEEKNTIQMSGAINLSDARKLQDLFPRNIVRGSTTRDTFLFDRVNGKVIDTLKEDTSLEILADKAYKWYNVRSSDGREGWVTVKDIYIDPEFKKNEDVAENSEIEQYVKFKGWTSPGEYLLWTDIGRQKLYILKNNDGWKVYRIMECSTGENVSPTVQGAFSVGSEKGRWLDTGGGTGAKYYTRFFGSYYFHSIKLSSRGTVLDSTLGMPKSMGCIRLAVENAKWIQENITAGTKLYIY